MPATRRSTIPSHRGRTRCSRSATRARGWTRRRRRTCSSRSSLRRRRGKVPDSDSPQSMESSSRVAGGSLWGVRAGRGGTPTCLFPPSAARPAPPPPARPRAPRRPGAAPERVTMASPISVLVVDDDAVSRALLRALVQAAGYEVTTADHGREAWDALQVARIPVVVSDWYMPEMDGPELCRRIRARPNEPYVYFILITP